MFSDSSKLEYSDSRMFNLNNSSDSTVYTESTNSVSVLPGYQVSAYARLLSAVFHHSKWLSNLRKHVESPKIQTY